MLIKLLKHSRLSICGNDKFIDLSIAYNKSSYIANHLTLYVVY